MRLAGHIAPLVGAGPALAERAAELCKADLLTGMVGEFPELQGIIGGYYARRDNEYGFVADAIRDHYAPKGPGDLVPAARVSVAVALADKLDQLAGFFAVDEKPTGSGDPYALRRAALGVIRLIRENGLRLGLNDVIEKAMQGLSSTGILGADDWRRNYSFAARRNLSVNSVLLTFEPNRFYPLDPNVLDVLSQTDVQFSKVRNGADDLFEFIIDRLRVQLRADGARHDVLAAVFAAGADDDLVRLLARTDAVTALLGTDDGANLLIAYRRAANILRIEEKKDGPPDAAPMPELFMLDEEMHLFVFLNNAQTDIDAALADENYTAAMSSMAALRPPLDAFFDKVTVNDPQPELRQNRLRLLFRVRATMDHIADFSKIEG